MTVSINGVRYLMIDLCIFSQLIFVTVTDQIDGPLPRRGGKPGGAAARSERAQLHAASQDV